MSRAELWVEGSGETWFVCLKMPDGGTWRLETVYKSAEKAEIEAQNRQKRAEKGGTVSNYLGVNPRSQG